MRITRLMLGAAMVAMLCLGAALVGAGTAHAAPAAGTAYVRVAHAAPAAPDVDVYVDGSKLLSDFMFGTVTGYVPLAAGSHEIAVTPAGKPVSAAVIKQQVTVQDGVNYTVAAIGDANTTPALVAFQDDNAIASGMAKVRVYHLSSDAGPVAVAAGGKTVIPSLSFKNASGYLSVPPGSYTFTVTLLNNNKSVPAPATLEANKVTSVFALGLVNGSGATAFKFVAASVAGVPTGMPPTGVNPHPAATTAASSATPSGLYAALAGLMLVLAGSVGLVAFRRRAR